MNAREFKNCLGRVTKTSRLVELQFNREYDISNDIWFMINQDFLTDEWTNALEYTTVTKTFSGDNFDKDYADSMKATLNFVFKESYNKAFYNELYNIWQEGSDRWMQFVNGGLNVRVTVFHSEDIWTRDTYFCASPMPSSIPFIQDATNEKTFEMPVTLNFEAEITEMHGMLNSLPVNVESLSATVVNTPTSTEITSTLSDINGDLSLVDDKVENPYIAIVYREDGSILNVPYSDNGDGTYTAIIQPVTVGEILLVSTCYIAGSSGNSLSYTLITQETVTIV